MESSTDQAVAHHKKALHSKRSFGKYPKSVESPAYDASEEDNDPLTDDAASAMSVHVHRSSVSTVPTLSTNAKSISASKANSRIRHNLASSLLTDSDGIDSPTYDGDIESSTTAGGVDIHSQTASKAPTHHHHHHSSTLSAILPSFPAQGEQQFRSASHDTQPVFISQPINVAAVPLRVPEEPAPVPQAKAAFNPASLTPEDIRTFVKKAIEGESWRKYKINNPPVDRPVRIYADGVYDLFHFGHALQLRQAKMSFPSVYLLVGVCSDKLVKKQKAQCVMNHAERCEAARHCRWVDEVVSDAPWVIDADFIEKWEIDYVAHDENPYASEGLEDVYAFVKSQGKFIPTRRTPGVSTSDLLERIVSGYRKRDWDAKLEKMGHSELKAEGSDYDDRSAEASRNVSRSASP